jgi:fermentation-respiration switch protein FrsA (DUF1100 family)
MDLVMPMLGKAAGMALAIYLLVAGAAWLGQRRLMYVPDATRVMPQAIGLTGVREQVLDASNGAHLVSWRATAAPGRPTILYLHGNAGNLASRADRFRRYQQQGFGLLMLSWRSYSGSTGSPTETNNVADAILAYQALRSEGVAAEKIVIYGESLGSGVAVQLAAALPIGALVLDAPYTSMVEMASLAYPYLPVRPLLLDRYESKRYIGKVKAPVLVLHGERDSIIPLSMGLAIHAASPEPKKLVLFPNGGHVDLDQYGAAEIVGKWIDETLAVRH